MTGLREATSRSRASLSLRSRVARWYDQELDEQIKAMTSLMEPVMIVIVGGIVALIAMSIFGPITAVMSNF